MTKPKRHYDLTLASEPMERNPTRAGNRMAVAFGNVRLNVRVQGGNDETELVNVSLIAFGDDAERLLRYGKGDCCYVIGSLGFTRWTPSDAEEPEQRFRIVIDGIADECPKPVVTRKRKRWETPGGMSQAPKANHGSFTSASTLCGFHSGIDKPHTNNEGHKVVERIGG